MTRKVRSPAAERQARRRARLRANTYPAQVELPAEFIEALLNLHWLDEAESRDRRKVAAAAARALALWSRGVA